MSNEPNIHLPQLWKPSFADYSQFCASHYAQYACISMESDLACVRVLELFLRGICHKRKEMELGEDYWVLNILRMLRLYYL